jgi:hypothetical protein
MSSLVLLVVIGLFVAAVLTSKGRNRRSERAWQVAAEQLGCHYDAPRGTWSSPAFARLEGNIEGANVVGYAAVETSPTMQVMNVTRPVEMYGTTSSIVTNAVATVGTIPPNFRVRIRPRREAVADPWTDAVDVKAGHELFDATFVAQTNAPDLLRRILSPDLVDRLLALRAMQFVIRDQETRVTCRGTLTDVPTITAMMRASSALARGADEVLSSWKAFSERVGGAMEAGDSWTRDSILPSIAVARGGIVFRIAPSVDGEVEIRGSRQGDPVRIHVDPALSAAARMRASSPHPGDPAGVVRFRVATATSDVEAALDLLAASAAEGAYR